jgi:site-specific DNA recombinase
VLIHAPDRRARCVVPQTLRLKALAQLGCPVLCLEHPISHAPKDPLLRQMRGAVAEDERALMADRARRGRLARLRAGPWLPWVHTPDGDRRDPEPPRDPTRWRIEATAASVVRQMFAWYTEDGLSLHAMAARLTRQQILTSRGGSHGPPATVKGLLRHAVYGGIAYGHREDEVEPVRWRGGALRPNASATTHDAGPARHGWPWMYPRSSLASVGRESKP